jgi:serine/threonine protein kinase
VKLADFGIATMSDATELTVHGQLVGTPKYVSPEQAVGQKATYASDIYAVGVLLFEMVAGDPPFDAETSAATLAAHSQAPVPSLQEARPDVPGWYAAVVERALAKDPADRFPDAAAMRAALVGGEAGALTEVLAAPAATRTMTLPMTAPAEEAGPRARPGWLIPALIAIVALLVGLGAWALSRDSGDTVVPPQTTNATNPPATAAPTTPPTSPPTNPPTAPPTSPPTNPPTAAPTTPPTTSPPAAVAPPGEGNDDKVPPGQEKKGGPGKQ